MIRTAFIFDDATSRPAQRRVLLHMDAFEREGIDVYPMVLPAGLFSRRKMFKDLEGFDIAVLQRRLIQPWEFRTLRAKTRILGYDFDDALIYGDSAARAFRSLSRTMKFRTILRGVDFATAGNAYLRDLTGLPPEKVFVVPTAVDTKRYAPAAKAAGGPVRIGWVGSRSALPCLEAAMGAIERVAATRPTVELAVVADAFPAPRPFMKAIQRKDSTEPADVASFDIGVMPLPDNPWTRGKCGFRLLLYGACGVASVASPVGANRDILVDGETGFFASNEDEWTARLTALVDDGSLRRRLGQAARRRVEEAYSPDIVVRRWSEVLKSVFERLRGRA